MNVLNKWLTAVDSRRFVLNPGQIPDLRQVRIYVTFDTRQRKFTSEAATFPNASETNFRDISTRLLKFHLGRCFLSWMDYTNKSVTPEPIMKCFTIASRFLAFPVLPAPTTSTPPPPQENLSILESFLEASGTVGYYDVWFHPTFSYSTPVFFSFTYSACLFHKHHYIFISPGNDSIEYNMSRNNIIRNVSFLVCQPEICFVKPWEEILFYIKNHIVNENNRNKW